MSKNDLSNDQPLVTLPKEGSAIESTSIILLVIVFSAVGIAFLVYYFCIRETMDETRVPGSNSLQTGKDSKVGSSLRISPKAKSSQRTAGLRAVSSRQVSCSKQASKATHSQASFKTPKQLPPQELPSPKGKSSHVQPPPPSMLDSRFGKMNSKILLDVDLDQPSKDDIDVKSYFGQVESKQQDKSKQNKSKASNAKSKAATAKSKTVAGGGNGRKSTSAARGAAGKSHQKPHSKAAVMHSNKLGNRKAKSRTKKK